MPNVSPAGSSPPVSGSVKDPQQLHRSETASYGWAFKEDAPHLGLPERPSVLDRVEVAEANRCPEQRNTGEAKTSGDDERACCQPRNREEVIKEISVSSTAFIGPVSRPRPELEGELSEFYKELEQIQKPDTVDGSKEPVTQSWPPPDTVNGNSENVYRPWARSINTPVVKEKWNNHRNTYRPYLGSRPQTDYRNTPQWRPQVHDWSNLHRFQNQWQVPPPNVYFYPPPGPGDHTRPPYSQPHRHQCPQPTTAHFQLSPDARLASSPSPASYAPYEAFERRYYEEQNSQDVNQSTRNNEPVLILMRGVPGSGKSTLARQISSRGPHGLILSTDDYFYQEDGYHFEPALLGDAHDWNHNRAKQAMLEMRTPIVIDNTNIRAWEMKPYVTAALEMRYRVDFVEPDTSWKYDPVELEKRNHHGVSRETIAKMLNRFELPISVDIVMNSYEPSHKRIEHHSRH